MWQPPGSVFGPVWTALYVLIAIAATLAVRDVHHTLTAPSCARWLKGVEMVVHGG